MEDNKKILIAIPAFNEQDNIVPVIEEIRKYQPCADILVINDCSWDDTYKIAKNQGVQVINLPINLGIGGTMQTAFKYALEYEYDYIIQVDGDGQHLPEEIYKLINTMEEKQCDMVIGSRFLDVKSNSTTNLRRCGIKVFYYLFKLLIGLRITDSTSGFRIFNKNSISILARYYPDDYPEPDAVIILHKHGLKIAEVGVFMRPRLHGESSITAIRSPYYMIKVINSILFTHIRTRWD